MTTEVREPVPLAEGWLTAEDAAGYLDLAYATLRSHRCRGTGPRAYLAQGRRVFYRVTDLDEWQRQRTVGQ